MVAEVLQDTLTKLQSDLPEKQRDVRDKAAAYERAKQVEHMAQVMADKFRSVAESTLAAAEQADHKMHKDQNTVLSTQEKAAQTKVDLALKKKAELHEEQTIAAEDQTTARLEKAVRKAKFENKVALNRVEMTARELKGAASQERIDDLVKLLEQAKSHERTTKSNQMNLQLALEKEQIQQKLIERTTEVDLKEEQAEVADKVSATEKDLLETRVLAARSTIQDEEAAIRKFNAHVKDLMAQIASADSDVVVSALHERLEKVQGDIEDAKTQIQQAKASIESGRIEMAVREDLRVAQTESSSAEETIKAAQQAKQRIEEELTAARLTLSATKKPQPALYQKVERLSAERDMQDAILQTARQQDETAELHRARAKLRKQLLTVGYETRSWAFVEEARHDAERASAAVAMATSVAKERASKVSDLRESLDKLNNPSGTAYLQKMIMRSKQQQRTASNLGEEMHMERQKERKKERTQLHEKLMQAFAEEEEHVQEDQRAATAEVKDLEIQLDAARTTEKPKLEKSRANIAQLTKRITSLQARIDALPMNKATKAERRSLQGKWTEAKTAMKVAQEEQRVISMDARNLENSLASAKSDVQKAVKQLKTISDKQKAYPQKMNKDRAEAISLSKKVEEAKDVRNVQQKEVDILVQKVATARDYETRERLQAFLDTAREKLHTDNERYEAGEEQETQMRNMEWNDLQTMKMELTRHVVSTLSRKIRKMKLSVVKLEANYKAAHDAVVRASKQSQGYSVKRVSKAERNKAQQKQKDLEEQLTAEKQALAGLQKQHELGVIDIAEMEKNVKLQNEKYNAEEVELREAREKRSAARDKENLARTAIEKSKNPKGKERLSKNIKAAQNEEDAARAEVEKVQRQAVQAQVRERDETKQKDKVELQLKKLGVKKSRLEEKVQSLKSEIAEDGDDKPTLKMELHQMQADLAEINNKEQRLSKKVDQLKVEGALDHAQRMAVELEVETFSKENLVSEREVRKIQEQLEKAPTSQKQTFEKKLEAAQAKQEKSEQTLSEARQRLHAADLKLERRTSYRGIAWRKSKLKAARRAHSATEDRLHLLRQSLRKPRENANKRLRLETDKIAEKQKRLVSATTALDSLRSVSGMDASRNKLRLEIEALKLDLKQRNQELDSLQKTKDGFDQKMMLATKDVIFAEEQEEYSEKEYRRARVLGEADDELASQVRDKVEFVAAQMEISKAKQDYAQQEKAIAAAQLKILSETDIAQKARLKQTRWEMITKLHDFQQKIAHMKKQAKFRETLISCESEEARVRRIIKDHIADAHKLQIKIKKVTAKIIPKEAADKLDADAEEAVANSVLRVSRKKLTLQMATQRGAGKARLKQLHAELAQAEKEQQQLKLRAAAAAQADSEDEKNRLQKQVETLKQKLKGELSHIEALRKKVAISENCQQQQQASIVKQHEQFLREKLTKTQSLTGNMFDNKHQVAAEQIHQIEKAAYQAKFREDDLRRKHSEYQGALQELMNKLGTAAGPGQQHMIQKLILHLKQKLQTVKGAMSIAAQQRSRTDYQQLHEAVEIAQGLKQKQETSILEPNVLGYPIKSRNSQREADKKSLQKPSAVRSAVLRILQQPD